MIIINKWGSYQSYKDRRPPWIRFHRSMLDEYKYHRMSADARALLPMLWLLASEDDDPVSGMIRISYEEITFRLRMEMAAFLSALQEISNAGYISTQGTENIECNQTVTKPLRNRNQTVTPETETETETETEKSKVYTNPAVNYETLTIGHIQEWLTKKRVGGKYLTIDEDALLEKFQNYCRANNKKYKDYIAAFRNAFEWDNPPLKGANNAKQSKAERLDAALERGAKDWYANNGGQSAMVPSIAGLASAKLPHLQRLQQAARGHADSPPSLRNSLEGPQHRTDNGKLPSVDAEIIDHADPGGYFGEPPPE